MKKIATRVLGIAALAVLLCLTFVFANHKVRLGQEAKSYPPPGTMVEVNGTRLHVYGEGDGEETLVFLPGWSTSSPMWDFKGLYSRLSHQYRIVVIERAGYGYSDPSDNSRDIGTVLEESRQALGMAKESGPFVLVPHSLAGLEAIYWAQQYPEEVQAIVGLDISFPETYEGIDRDMMIQSMKQQKRHSTIQNFGFIRFAAGFFDDHEPLLFDLLSGEEKPAYKAAVYRSYYTKSMINEGYAVLDNAQKVEAAAPPTETPMLLFIATEQGEEHRDLSLRYLSQMTTGMHQILDGGHYIHDFHPQEIADTMMAFLSSL